MAGSDSIVQPDTPFDSSLRPLTSLPHSLPTKRLSPGLELRLRRLEKQKRRREAERRRDNSIGRIPEQQLADLERLQAQREIEVRRRGKTWTGPPVRVMPPTGGVRLDGGPVLSEPETSALESDVSSVRSFNDRLVAADSSEGEGEGNGALGGGGTAGSGGFHDSQKYRMPDIGKTRLHLRTKEPLSPTPRQVPPTPRRQMNDSRPTTPISMRGVMDGKATSPLAHKNGSTETLHESDFVSSGLSRAGSIYTLGRMSFAGQLAQLTSIRLPDPDSLAKRMSSIPTSREAARALSDAAEQIRMWVSKASELLSGLNAEDDVEWAAAGGRDGIEEVDNAITRFDMLIQVYVAAIERLQTRQDVGELSAQELMASVKQMEGILNSWQRVKATLKGVKEQVEVAMEWEELWNTVLGEIGQEMDSLNRLIFEMEEKRHEGAPRLLNGRDSIAIDELETIMDERPRSASGHASNRLSFPGFASSSPLQPPPAQDALENPNLLGLFARMQPLRASLDFLPMRLSVFHCRGNPVFPTACLELEHRRDELEAQWKKLEADAEALRRELGEDRWVMVFRNAGRQAMKMCDSIVRSYTKLKDGMDAGEPTNDLATFTKKTENYEAKKLHYSPAIERVLAIIDRGVMDRLTVNGEILRLQSDMRRRWTALQADMRDLDLMLEDVNAERSSKQLRDSVSTVVSSEHSVAGGFVDTPGTSPASSVVGASRKNSFGSRTPTPLTNAKMRQPSYNKPTQARRSISRVASVSSIPQRMTPSRAESTEPRSSPTPSPAATRIQFRHEPPTSNRPRWRNSTKSESRDFLPLSALEPSPYAKTPVTPKTNYLRSSRHISAPTSAPPTRTRTPLTHSPITPGAQSAQPVMRKSSLPMPSASIKTPSPLATRSLKSSYPPSATRTPGVVTRRSSLLALPPVVTDGNEADTESPSHHKPRPPSALASGATATAGARDGRRSSMLPVRAKGRVDERGT